MFFFINKFLSSTLQPIFIRLLDYHIQKTDQNNATSYIMHGHVAALLNLISEIAKKNWNLISVYLTLLIDLGVRKWFAQTCNLTEFSVRHFFNVDIELYKFVLVWEASDNFITIAMLNISVDIQN